MKKIFVLILVFITTAASFIPCCQADNCCDEQMTTSGDHEKSKTEGACSPFFACATCPVSVEISGPIQLNHPIAEKQVYNESIVNFNSAAFLNSYWQPPRFC